MSEEGEIFAERYQLLQLAGKGGMAEVWCAEQRGAAGFARPVALKRILPHLASQQEFVRMFIEEARVCAQLMHPNIVQIYDFGVEKGSYYLVMEWVEGLNLSKFLGAYVQRRRYAPWPIVAAMAIEALRALGAAHERLDYDGTPTPVIHRDVTPGNILVGTNGIVKLTDFGLARAMDRARLTDPDVIKGKMGYLAPELTHGAPATPQTDIYALGVTIWQALTNRKLFGGGTNAEVFMKARKAAIPDLARSRPDVPAGFVDIVDQALAFDPGERFSSSGQMKLGLTQLLRECTVTTDAKVLAEEVRQARDALGVGMASTPPPPLNT